MESSFDPTRSICRFDVDPLIAGATPPSYDFPTDESAQKRLESTTYSVSFFSEVVMLALSRLQSTWPQCHREFGRLVKLICHLPDASFRSCSASRYVGIVLLSCKDNSILDLEESLVHEWGHQLLYNIVEVCPVVCAPEDDALYTLPWSGQKRDLYGYFHAYFIYVLLAKYLDRVRGRPPAEERQAKKRMAFILRGLLKALPDFLESKHVTPQGSLLLANIAREVNALAERHRTLLIEVAA